MTDLHEATATPTPPQAAADEPDIPLLATTVYRLLKPLDAADRKRVLFGAFGMLGDTDLSTAFERRESVPPDDVGAGSSAGVTRSGGVVSEFTTAARPLAWMKKNSITDEVLEAVYHVDKGELVVYADIPGTSKREMTRNAYLLTGVQAFLSTGEARIIEADALALCKRDGAYDKTNHATTRGSFSSLFHGTKESGFLLTPLGQNEAATLIKTIANIGNAEKK